ncbi:unnamed protein product [Schistosoma margrebowiei]|uniref:Uncharacterized protein n=1 Tax=Schistosoma margrebowiei TaxID=48269 RepID=A0A183M2F6_9TREM|nr:unnamed protein product [Schistosoma margrebowiei]
MSALEIAAEEMRIGHMRPKEIQQILETREESTIYSQIIHFVNLIINFRIPVHIGAAVADIYGEDTQNNDELKNDITGINGMVSKIPDRIISDNDNYNNNKINNNTNDHNYRKQYTGSTNSLNDIPVTNQINHALKIISQTEGFIKNTSRYTSDNYSNHLSISDGFYNRYSAQNSDKLNQATLLNHITVLENWLLKFVKIVGEENNLVRERITEVEGKIKGNELIS